MTEPISILLFDGDAESQWLADAEAVLQAVLPNPNVRLTRAWATRPDCLAAAAEPPPPALRARQLLPDADPRELLAQHHDLVIFSLLPAIALPGLRHAGGGRFLAHAGLRAGWSEADAALIAAECAAEPPMAPLEAAQALEPVIEALQARGAAVALCAAFRHVTLALEYRAGPGPGSLRERIRQLNLEIARLSQRTGCFVLDLDRPLAQQGGASLGADCSGGGERAAEIVLDEFVALVLDAVPAVSVLEDA